MSLLVWNKVSDGLPTVHGWYVVMVGNGREPETVRWIGEADRWSAATHWMGPIPSTKSKLCPAPSVRLEEAVLETCKELVKYDHEDLASTVLEFLGGGKLSEDAAQRIRMELELETE